MVNKYISYFTRNLPKKQQSTVGLLWILVTFGMSSTVLTFGGKYCEYGDKDIETKGSAIDRCISAFLRT